MRSSPTAKPLTSFVTSTLFLMTLVFVFAQSAMGQATTGTLKGTVVDPNDQVVTGATVTVKNQATGIESPSTTTGGEGSFTIPDLLPGKYTVTVSATSGFKTQAVTDVNLKIGEITDIKVSLALGAPTETVTVVGNTEEVVQTSSQISNSFETRKVQDLPSNSAGGGIDTIALLTPGVVPGFGNVNSNGTTLSVNGQRARSNNFTIDGTDNNDLSIGGPSFFVDNQEQVQEFQIITNNYSAQYGRNQGAVINIVNKSGTNEFHGSGFEYYRDPSGLDAMNNIQRRDPTRGRRDKIVSNVFGGTIGGPIKRNKAFFFYSFQDIRQFQNFNFTSTSLAILPSQFPLLTAQYPGNPAIQTIVNQSVFALQPQGLVRADRPTDFFCFPKNPLLAANCTDPTNANFANGLKILAASPQFVRKTPFVEPEHFVRGDVNVSKNNNFNVKYQWQKSPETESLTQSNGFFGDVPFKSWNINGQDVWTISPHLVNEVKVAKQQLAVLFGGSTGTCDPLKGCMTTPDKLDQNFTRIGYSGVRGVGTGTSLQAEGPATNLPQGRTVQVFQLSETATYTHGRHTMVMGVDFRSLNNSVPFLPNVNGSFNFTSTARLAQNQPASLILVGGKTTLVYKEKDQFYFFQDDLKVRPNLTLNLGVRYEYTGQPINLLNQLTVARENDPTQALWRQSLPLEARTAPFIPADKNNWAPRVGFAYSPHWGDGKWAKLLFGGNDQSVIRGGYSIAYDPAFYNILLNNSTSTPTVFNNTLSDTGSVGSPSINLAIPANPTGDVVRTAFQSLLQKNTFDPRFLTWTIVSPNFHSPYSQQWSFGIQRQFGRNHVAEVRYVGNRGVGLFQSLNSNPFFGSDATGTGAFAGKFTNGGVFFGFSSAGVWTSGGQPVAGATVFDFPAFRGGLNGAVPLTGAQCPAPTGVDNTAVCRGRLVAGRGQIRERSNSATSSYHSLQMRYNGRLSNQLTIGASYTFSKALDNASEIFSFGEGFTAANPFDTRRAEKSTSGFDRPQAGSANVIWDIPFAKGQKGLVGHLGGGWQINGTYVVASGRPFTVSEFCNFGCGINSYQDNAFQSGFIGLDALRAFWGNRNAPRNTVGITDVDATLLGFIGPTFVASPTGLYSLNAFNQGQGPVAVTANDVRYIFNGPGAAKRFGNPYGDVPRNSERGPALNQLNIGLFKNTQITERVKLQLRLEMFNALNHPAAGYGIAGGSGALPDTAVEDAGARDGFNDFGGITKSARRLQLGARLTF
jgi:outer membrane receptor protein involved in Fe transport